MEVTNINEEREVLRVVVGPGGATHPVLGTIPEAGCFPIPVTKTGAIDTDNAGSTAGLEVLGDGTLFQTENISPGDYLANADGILRRIRYVFSENRMKLEAKFPSSLSAADVRWVPKAFYKYMLAESTGSATAELQEEDFPAAAKWIGEGAPVSYDVSTANSQITFSLSR